MNEKYKKIITSLYQSLGITPKEIEEITSLQIDDKIFHITEHPESNLLMFSNLGHLDNLDLKYLLSISMFTDIPNKPIMAFDEFSNGAIIWNRQHIDSMAEDSAFKQLEVLTEFADKALDIDNQQTDNKENDDPVDPNAVMV